MLPRWKLGKIFAYSLSNGVNYICVNFCVCVVTQVYFQYFRQTLTFLDKTVSPIMPISAEYLAHGALHYEFSTDILWSPIQLIRISDPQAQVRTYFILLLIYI